MNVEQIKKLTTLNKEEVKLIEHVNENVSDKYVPIFTSELIDLLEPEFQFDSGMRVKQTETGHYVDLKKANDTIRIYNSFDRSMALRVHLVSDGISIPLGIDRLIHRGEKASNFQEEFKAAKQDILDAVIVAKTFKDHLDNTIATKEIAKAITESIFVMGSRKKDNKDITDIVNYADLLLDQNISVSKYINISIRSYLKGEYNYTKNDVKMSGKPKRSVLGIIHLENRLVKTLEEKFPEYFL